MTYFKVKMTNFAEKWQVCTPEYLQAAEETGLKQFIKNTYYNGGWCILTIYN